jgi:hypothetical protein
MRLSLLLKWQAELEPMLPERILNETGFRRRNVIAQPAPERMIALCAAASSRARYAPSRQENSRNLLASLPVIA